MDTSLYRMLKEFDFSDGAKFLHSVEYDLTENDDVERLDNDSADGSSCVRILDLSYSIDAKHYSTYTKGRRYPDMVTVIWKFWREEDE